MLARKTPDVFITNSTIHQYNTRSANQLRVPQIGSTLASKSPYYSSVKIYNSLPRNITQELNMTKFKNKLKDFLFEAAYYTIEELFDKA